MDSLITAAARALASGDALSALNHIALRDDPPALALRGIAMAQLGDLARAKLLLRRAARAFGPREAVARARCAVAEAEIALVSRDLNWPVKALDTARNALEQARRQRQCRVCALPQNPLPPSDRPPRRGRASTCGFRSLSTATRITGGPRAGCCRHRNAAPADQGGGAQRWRGPNTPRGRPASRRCWPKLKARPLSSIPPRRG